MFEELCFDYSYVWMENETDKKWRMAYASVDMTPLLDEP